MKILITEEQLSDISEKFQILPDYLLPPDKTEEFLNNDNFTEETLNDPQKRVLIRKLEQLKDLVRKFLNTSVDEIKDFNPFMIHKIILKLNVLIKKMRLVVQPRIILGKNRVRDVEYLLAKAYWIDDKGNFYYKFNISLGRYENINNVDHKDLSRRFSQMMWKYFNEENPGIFDTTLKLNEGHHNVIMSMRELAEIICNMGFGEDAIPIWHEMLIRRYKHHGDDGVVDLFSGATGVKIEPISRGKYIYSYK
jgi:hypothetical protein